MQQNHMCANGNKGCSGTLGSSLRMYNFEHMCGCVGVKTNTQYVQQGEEWHDPYRAGVASFSGQAYMMKHIWHFLTHAHPSVGVSTCQHSQPQCVMPTML